MLSTSDGSPLSFGNCLKPCYRIRTTRQLAIYLLLTCLQRRVPLPLSCFHPMLASMPLFILAYEYPLVYFPAAYHHRGKWPPPVLTTALPRSTYPHVHVHHTPTVGVSASPSHRGERGHKQNRSRSRSYGPHRRYVCFTDQPVVTDLPSSTPQNPSSSPAPIRGRIPCQCISRTPATPTLAKSHRPPRDAKCQCHPYLQGLVLAIPGPAPPPPHPVSTTFSRPSRPACGISGATRGRPTTPNTSRTTRSPRSPPSTGSSPSRCTSARAAAPTSRGARRSRLRVARST